MGEIPNFVILRNTNQGNTEYPHLDHYARMLWITKSQHFAHFIREVLNLLNPLKWTEKD